MNFDNYKLYIYFVIVFYIFIIYTLLLVVYFYNGEFCLLLIYIDFYLDDNIYFNYLWLFLYFVFDYKYGKKLYV